MKTEFAAAITQLSAERNLPRGVVLAALEAALASAYKRQASSPEQEISVKIDSDAGKVKVYVKKVVVESVADPDKEISIVEARKLRDEPQVGDVVEMESAFEYTGRITAQMVRQVILQRLREAENRAIYKEFVAREGEIVDGIVQYIEPERIYIRVDRTEAILPLSEQVSTERYYRRQRMKFYLLEIAPGGRGSQIIVSRSHPNLVRRLFELEIPELYSGVVEIKAIARDAGRRTKVAVASRQEGVEPVGCCLGSRGIRLQGVISELNGEKIDIIQWHPDQGVFVANALSPAQVASIEIDDTEKVASVIVPDKQLSLAIGKEGQNARLAARLTGWRIDIRSTSAVEVKKAKEEELLTIVSEEPIGEPHLEEAISEPEMEAEVPSPVFAQEAASLGMGVVVEKPEGKPFIRFAEDILPSGPKEKKRGKKTEEKPGGRAKGKQRKRQVFLKEASHGE